jgi:hypothetical protein
MILFKNALLTWEIVTSNGLLVQKLLQNEILPYPIYIAIVISSYYFYFHNFEDGTYPKWPSMHKDKNLKQNKNCKCECMLFLLGYAPVYLYFLN